MLLGCLTAALLAVPPWRSRRAAWIGLAVSAAFILIARLFTEARTGLDLAATCLLIAVAMTVGRELLATRTWPTGTFVAAVAVVTATGAYLRADRLDTLVTSAERPALQPDAVYYQQHALATVDPFAAGEKSPLWSALNAPLVRSLTDRDLAMRLSSWFFGILLIPAVALAIGRLFAPVVGVIVAGTLAVDSWLIDLCAQGLREELGAALWMAVFVLLFAQRTFSWRRAAAVGVVCGVLLLLRNTDVPILMALIAYGLIRGRTPWPRTALALLLPLIIVMPFYVNQYRAHGDAFYLENRDARYHANMEFHGRPAPPGLSMPTDAEFAHDFYAGQPLSPAAYLFRYHTLRENVANQWTGLRRALAGEFFTDTSTWLALACTAGLIATLLCAQQRFAALFVAGSVLGIRAHLIATGPFEARHLLPVLVIWLAAGWWLIAAAVQAGVTRWTVGRSVGRRGGEGESGRGGGNCRHGDQP